MKTKSKKKRGEERASRRRFIMKRWKTMLNLSKRCISQKLVKGKGVR